MISIAFINPEEKWLLSLSCGVKKLSFAEKAGTSRVGICFEGYEVLGQAASLLVLEALAPAPSLFPNGNLGMPLALLHWQETMALIATYDTEVLTANAELIVRQMHDDRPYLQGDSPGLADIASASWLLPKREALSLSQQLHDWLDRMTSHVPSHSAETPTLNTTPNFAALESQGLLEIYRGDGPALITSPLDT